MPWKHRPSILQKLLLFILVPIGLEIGFLAGALWLFHQSEIEVQQEARINQVSTLLEQLVHALYGAGSDIIGAATLGPDITNKTFAKHIILAEQCMADLKSAAHGYSEESETVDKLCRTCEESIKILKQSYTAAAQGPQGLMFMKGHRLTRQIEKITRETIDQVTKLRDLEERRKNELPTTQAQTKLQLQLILWSATIVNVLFGIFLATYLNRNLTSRLAVMVENTSRVAAGQALLPKVTGADELSQLDESMHQTAALLKTAEARQRELEQSRKQFVAMVGHDLKNPLHFVQLSLEALTNGLIEPGSESGEKKIRQCAEEIQRLVNLSNDLIWAAKSDAESFDLKPEPTLLWTVFERASRAVESLAGTRQIEIVRSVPEDLQLHIDRARLIQVLVNILSNAIQASPEKTTVTLVGSRDSNCVNIDIIDQGKGLPEEELPKVFEKFYRVNDGETSQNHEGMGLGLAICESIVAAHQGKIIASNRDEGGCQFRITLPLSFQNAHLGS